MPVIHDETNDPSGDITVNARQPYSPPVEGILGFGKGLGVGAAKGVAGMIPERLEGQEWKNWSSSPGEGGAESAGEWAGDIGANVAPFFLMPELGVARAGITGLGNLALRARTAGKLGQAGYERAIDWGSKAINWAGRTAKGAAGGATQAAIANEDTQDPWQFGQAVARGAVEGGTMTGAFAAGRMGFEALPPALQHRVAQGALGLTVAGGGLMLWDRAGGHHWVPWHLLYAGAAPMLGMAKGVSKLPPAVIGAASEWIAQRGGYEGGSPPEQDDTVLPKLDSPQGPPVGSGILNQPEPQQEQSDGSAESQ